VLGAALALAPAGAAGRGLPARAAGLLLLGVLGGCSPGGPPSPATGEDGDARGGAPAVLRVDGVPVTAAEVDRVAEHLGVLNPANTRPFLRRNALVAHLLPRLSVALELPAERAGRRAEAEEALARLRAGEPPTGELEVLRLEAAFPELGFELWSRARGLEPGRWEGPFEGLGRFLLLRLESRSGGDDPVAETFALEHVALPYVPPDWTSTELDRAIDARELTFEDPDWEAFVPLAWRHRMRGIPDGRDEAGGSSGGS